MVARNGAFPARTSGFAARHPETARGLPLCATASKVLSPCVMQDKDHR
jgi:hypothetical protein